MNKDEKFGIVISDSDLKFQNIAAHLGFIATVQKENDAIFYLDRTSTAYNLLERFYMWYDQEAGFAVIEPVATDPDYRKMGLGKAAVLEGIRRTGELGAKTALVGSSQQFYYSIGLRPFSTATIWRKSKKIIINLNFESPIL